MSRIEKETRDVRLGEAIALSQIFELPLGELARPGRDWPMASIMISEHTLRKELYAAMRTALSDFIESRRAIETHMREVVRLLDEGDMDPETRARLDRTRRDMEKMAEVDMFDEVTLALKRAYGATDVPEYQRAAGVVFDPDGKIGELFEGDTSQSRRLMGIRMHYIEGLEDVEVPFPFTAAERERDDNGERQEAP